MIILLLLQLIGISQAQYEEHIGEPIVPLPIIVVQENDPKVKLGQELFSDRLLSKNNSISCASCHNLSAYGVDSKQKSIGINSAVGDINSPTVFNSVYNFRQFWDGRAKNLAEQVSGPIAHPKEMGSSWGEIIAKLSKSASYAEKFKRIYGGPITKESIVDAIVTFEKTLTTPNSRFDQFLRGDKEALSVQEKKGYEHFKSYGCIACHQGVNVGGNMYQNMGVMGDYFKERSAKLTSADYGRFNVTGLESDRFSFKVPGLRNVAETAPYFHDGSAKSLSDAVHAMAKYQLGRDLKSGETEAIVSFLKTLTGRLPSHIQPLQKQAGRK